MEAGLHANEANTHEATTKLRMLRWGQGREEGVEQGLCGGRHKLLVSKFNLRHVLNIGKNFVR